MKAPGKWAGSVAIPGEPTRGWSSDEALTTPDVVVRQNHVTETRAPALIGQQAQAAYWAVFHTLMLISASAIPLPLILRRVKH